MKRLNSIFITLMGFTILCCSVDEDKEVKRKTDGELMVNGQVYELPNGLLVRNLDDTNSNFDSRTFYLALHNGEATNENNGVIYSDNTTQYISFLMYSSVEGSGNVENTIYPTYNISDPGFEENEAFTRNAGISTNVIFKNGQFVSADQLSTNDLSGQATIDRENEIYTVTFSFSNNENTVTGAYTGPLTLYK